MGWFSDAHKRLKKVAKSPGDVLKHVINPVASTAKIALGEKGKDPAGLKKYYDPKIPVTPDIPAAPMIDDGQIARQQGDRSRKRRGVFANLFSASSGSGNSTLG